LLFIFGVSQKIIELLLFLIQSFNSEESNARKDVVTMGKANEKILVH
jgi:hypothetical protein